MLRGQKNLKVKRFKIVLNLIKGNPLIFSFVLPVVSWCTGTQGNNHCTPFFTNCLAVEHCWVFCIGSCEPVHEDRTLLPRPHST